ncbi:MAG: metalloregulator ArsR/SmtB family transcription factor [Gammaproteobacteria bacterium]|nr:metalloregulator ArsR/SmtB family transcription factor [Gammaproteobacteria bacterium]
MTKQLKSIDISQLPPAREQLLAALSGPGRRAIFNALLEGPKVVKVIACEVSMSQPAVSQHLKLMKDMGLAIEKRDGRSHTYALNPLALDWLSMQFGLLRDDALGRLEAATLNAASNSEFDSVDKAMRAWTQLWPGIDEFSSGLILRICMLAHRIKELSTAVIARHGLNLIEFQILTTLGTFEHAQAADITAAEVAKRSLLPAEIVDLYLPRLASQKLLEFTRAETDKLPSTLIITAAGKLLLERILYAQKENELQPLYQLAPEQRSRLATILRPLLQKLYNKNPPQRHKK